MKKLPIMCAALAAMVNCDAAVFRSMSVSADLPPEKCELLSKIVFTRAKERCEFRSDGRELNVAFALDPALAGESCRVSVKGDEAKISAGRFSGLLYGAGRLLRSIEWSSDGMRLAESDGVYTPAKPFRCAYWARHFYNWYHMAEREELVRYAEDLALWGVNTFKYQFSYPGIDLKAAKPGDVERFERVSKEVAAALKELDLDFCAGGGGNQAPHDTDPALRAVPNADPKRGNAGFNVCPAKKGGMEFLLDQQRRALAKYEGMKLDWLSHWPFDEGGCECEKCRPWGGNGFIEMCRKLAAQNKAARPEIRTMLSTWTFHDDEYELLWKYLAKDESKWIDGLLIDSHEDFPEYPLTHPLPRKVPVITFPEISMWGRQPWGGFGAIAMPARFERLFRQVEKLADGFMFYSEGLFEDINKAVVIRLYSEPKLTWREIVREYCRYEFPGADPEKFIELLICLENTQVLPNFKKNSLGVVNVGVGDAPAMGDFETRCRYCLKEATRGEKLSSELDREITGGMNAKWRWRQLRLRTIIDKAMFTHRDWHSPEADAAYRELARLYNAKRTYDWVRPPRVPGE